MPTDATKISTPSLLLNEEVLNRNLSRVSTIAKPANVDLRPHCKTAKCVEVAKRATAEFSGGITVSTLNEAEFFTNAGFAAITYAVSIVPSKLPRIARLVDRGVDLIVIVESLDMATEIAEQTQHVSSPLSVRVEIEAGANRTGVTPDASHLIDIAKVIDGAAGLRLDGVLAFGGAGYKCRSMAAIESSAEVERSAAVGAATRIRDAGIECDVVSIGSTPHVLASKNFDGVTEVRPGVYVFGDLMMHALGLYAYEDIAVTILASVIGHNRKRNQIFIDAGALALSKDHGIELEDLTYATYGLIRSRDGFDPYPGIGVVDVNQEHGFIECLNPDVPFPFDNFPVGSTVEVIPNHVCHSIASYDRFNVVQDGVVTSEWKRTIGW